MRFPLILEPFQVECDAAKRGLIQAFIHRILRKDPSAVAVGGSGMAYTGIGDPYHLFSEILARLTGESLAAEEAVAEQDGRLQHLVPLACQVILEHGPDLVGSLLPGESLVRRAAAHAGAQDLHGTGWYVSLCELVEHRSAGPAGRAVPQQTHLQPAVPVG